MTLLQHHILALALTAITTFALGLLVFLADPKRRLNQIFGLYSLLIVWWACCEGLIVGAGSQQRASEILYFDLIGIILIAPTFVHTVFLLAGEKEKISKFVIRLSYLLSSCFLIPHLFFGSLTHPPKPVGYTLFFVDLTAPMGVLLMFTFFLLVNIGLWKLWVTFRQAEGHRRLQFKYLFWGSLIGYLGGSPDWLLGIGITLPWVNPFGIYGVPMYSIAMTYAVLHHRLFNVNVVIRKSLIYSALITILTVGYFGLIYLVEHLFQRQYGYRSPWLSVGAFSVMALVFQPLKSEIQTLIDWLLFRQPQEALVNRIERLEQETLGTEKLKATARMAAGLAHELKNPLTVIKTFAEHLPRNYNDPRFRDKFVRIIGQEVEKMHTLLQRLLDFAKPSPPTRAPVSLGKLIDETLDFLQDELTEKRISVVRGYAQRDMVLADPAQIKQVLLNIFLNSLQAMTRPGCITISTVGVNGHLELLIMDTGPGIPKQDVAKVFEPFYTTKEEGTGLGLSIVETIVRQHYGRISIDSDTGHGTTVRIRLPSAT